MTFNEIQELIRMVGKHKISEFILREGDFKLVIRNQIPTEGSSASSASAPSHPPVAAVAPPPARMAVNEALSRPEPTPAPAEKPSADDGSSRYIAIKSPMVGTFYRGTSPDKPPLVKVGDSLEIGMPVCIIEAMKLFNEIEADVKGKIVKVLVEDASPVEYDQPLFMVDPS